MLDIIIIILVLYSGYEGYKKGFVSQFFMFMTFAGFFYKGLPIFFLVKRKLKYLLKLRIENSYTINYLSLVISFFIIMIIVFFLKKVIKNIIYLTSMEIIDKLLGSVLGIIKGVISISIAFFFLKKINQKFNFVSNDFFISFFENGLFYIRKLLFDFIKKVFLLYKKN